MKNYLTYSTLVFLIIISCKKKQSNCSQIVFKDLTLKPVNANLRIPANCILEDTVIYDNVYNDQILNYQLRSSDSLFFISVSVENNKMYGTNFSFSNFYWANRNEVENWTDAKSTLLKDTTRSIEKVKAGYLKYLIKQNGDEFYEGRIFFINEYKITNILMIEKINNKNPEAHLAMDCVFELMSMY